MKLNKKRLLTRICFCCSYLHITGDQFGRPIHGQREVSGYSYPETGNEWKATVRLVMIDSSLRFVTIHNTMLNFVNKLFTNQFKMPLGTADVHVIYFQRQYEIENRKIHK